MTGRDRSRRAFGLLAALAAIASCGESESDTATALDLVVDPRVPIDQIDIRGLTLDGQSVALTEYLLPRQPTRLHNGDILRLLFDDDRGGTNVVVTAIGLFQGAEVTGPATASGTLQMKHPVQAALVLGTGGTGGGGRGGAGGSAGGGGTTGAAGGGGSAGASGAGGSGTGGGTGGGAGRGGASGAAGASGAGGASGGGAGAAGRGGTGGSAGTGGTGAAGRGGGGGAGTGGAAGMAGRGGTGGTAGSGATAGRGGSGGGAGAAGRGGSSGGAGGSAPRCMPADTVFQTTATQLDQAMTQVISGCGFSASSAGVVTYAQVNGSRFTVMRDLEFEQSRTCGRCIEVTAATRTTIVTVVGPCSAIPGAACGGNNGLMLSSFAYGDIATGQTLIPVTWRYVPCQVQGPVYARLIDATLSRVVILNHTYGIASVESGDNISGQWVTLSRSADNAWSYNPAITLAGRPLRVTDINGGVVTGTLTGSTTDQALASALPMCVP